MGRDKVQPASLGRASEQGPQTSRVSLLARALQEWLERPCLRTHSTGLRVGEEDRVLTIQDDPYGPEVHTGVVLPLTHHLWGHVEGGATEHMLLIPRRHVLCKAKVCGQVPDSRAEIPAASALGIWSLTLNSKTGLLPTFWTHQDQSYFPAFAHY